MKVGILGLGLIGGSLARAYSIAGHSVLAQERDASILSFAMLAGAVDGELNDEAIASCDLILLAIYPDGSAQWLEEHAHLISREALVLDCCGVKEEICRRCFPLAKRNGFTFVGGHPMAGTHNSGFKYARANLFHGAPMVIVPMDFDNIALLSRIEKLLAPAGFGSFSVTTAAEHDRMIAFTSQLAHVASNAYIKSPTAKLHKGFSAGSYKDMTRVAWLNPTMWAELFMENRDYLLNELDAYIASLNEYKTALEQGDTAALTKLLDDGRRLKEEVDGR